MDVDQNTTKLRSTTTGCILHMHLDILYKIFEILIEKNEDPHLSILRHGSQVCTRWRGLLLSSPSLWGKSLDFDVLMDKPAWRDEVVRRSGESFVHITRLGGVGRSLGLFDKEEEVFLGSFIKDNWERIKSLRITLPVESVITKLFDISLLQSPHLHLEELEVREHYMLLRDKASSVPVHHRYIQGVERSMWRADFGGHAPRLRRYLTGPTFQFPYRTSWLQHLREAHVTLSDCFVPDVLDKLCNMTSLEHLQLTLEAVRTAHPDARARMSNLVLPRLKYLCVISTGHTPEFIDLVNYIKPRAGCSVHVAIHYWNALSASDISAIVRALAAFPWNDGEGGQDQDSAIEVDGTAIRIKSPSNQFYLRGPFGRDLWTPCLQHFAASPSFFCNAKAMRLLLGEEVVDSFPSADMTFTQILSNMSSLVHLSTDWITLRLIHRLSVDDEPNPGSRRVLPALESLTVWGPSNGDLNDLEVWLDYRARHTLIPIQNVTIHWPFEDCPSLEVFQRFTNLQVVLFDWKGDLTP
ncbi:hypothetical protein CPC08DRAFT_710291 [Agrocybe pediades]|nr:hypothetical protein CPC08DRAFT_710291 [Agrocybe pediades]